MSVVNHCFFTIIFFINIFAAKSIEYNHDKPHKVIDEMRKSEPYFGKVADLAVLHYGDIFKRNGSPKNLLTDVVTALVAFLTDIVEGQEEPSYLTDDIDTHGWRKVLEYMLEIGDHSIMLKMAANRIDKFKVEEGTVVNDPSVDQNELHEFEASVTLSKTSGKLKEKIEGEKDSMLFGEWFTRYINVHYKSKMHLSFLPTESKPI